MVFSPAAFHGAPYSELFTIGYDVSEGRPSQAAGYANADALDAALARETAKRFPMVASVRVKDALEAVDKIAGQLALAARGRRASPSSPPCWRSAARSPPASARASTTPSCSRRSARRAPG